MTSQQVVEYLMNNQLLKDTGTGYEFTDKFDKKFKRIQKGSQSLERLKQFIKDSNIPYRIKMSNGGFFFPGLISADAEKGLEYRLSALNYNYETLVAVTREYYNNSRNSRLPLAKYFGTNLVDILYKEAKPAEIENPKTNSPFGGRVRVR